MSTQEQATLIGQELERKLSIFKNYSIIYDNITDNDDFYVIVKPSVGHTCITEIAMNIIIAVVERYDLCYFIGSTSSGKPRISIY